MKFEDMEWEQAINGTMDGNKMASYTSKQQDIPQWVMEKAVAIYLKRCDEVSRIAADFEEEEVVDLIARAILAATLAERREIQTEVQNAEVPSEFSNSWQLGYRQCRINTVAAIRKRGEA